MREGWSLEPVSAVAQVVAGQSPKSEFYNSEGKGEPFYQGKKEFGDRFIGPPTTWTTSANRIAEAGDILMSVRAPVGPLNITQQRICIGRGLAAIRPGPRIDRDFLYYALLERQTEIRGTEGAVFASINKTQIGAVKILLPPLAEQKRIVAILDEAFEAIERAEIAYNSIPDGVDSSMSRFFAQLVPIKGHSSWTPTTIADVAVQRKGAIRTGPFGSQLLHSEFVDDGVRVLGIDNAVHNKFAWDQVRCITDAKYEGLQRYTVHPGDVLITIMGTCGRCAVIPSDIPLSITSKHLCCITLDQQLCLPEFLKLFFLKHPMARQHLASQTKGAIMDGLNMTIIKSVPLMLPSIDEQREIVDQLSAFQNGCTDLSRIATERQDKCDELRNSLLSAAFRGELEQSTSHVASFVGAAS